MKQTIILLGNGLESSCGTTPEFLTVYRTFKKEFNKILREIGCIESEIKRGHFSIYGFFTAPTGQIWYFSLEDLRSPVKTIMYRTAKSYKDFRGGTNHWAYLDNLKEELRIS